MKKNNTYVLRFDESETDQIFVSHSLEKLTECICNYCEEYWYYPDKNELLTQMQTREKEGYTYLFDGLESIPSHFGITVTKAEVWD